MKCSPQTTWNVEICFPLSEFPKAKVLTFRIDTVYSNVQQNYERIFENEVAFRHLANRVLYWFGGTLFLLKKWLPLSYMLNCLQLFPTLQLALQADSSAMT
jgi:hypothetical protein